MSNLRESLNDNVDALEVDRLASIVEGQIGNVLGGGYSQYSAVHGKDAQA